MKNNKTYWHPAFIEALQAELEEYKDILEFYPEFPLTLEPLKIDSWRGFYTSPLGAY